MEPLIVCTHAQTPEAILAPKVIGKDDLERCRTLGATLSYNRSMFLERLRLMAAIGITNSDDGTDSATSAQALGGLRYTF